MKAAKLFLLVAAGARQAYAIDFAWGFGGSAYQTEGAYNVDGKDVGVFDNWTFDSGLNANVADDSYTRYATDLAILPTLGATLYRFSVSWPRVMGGCTATVNQKGLQFYSDMIDSVLNNGAVPMLTMYHWDLPQACFDQFQGFATEGIIQPFLAYADLLFTHYGDRVKYWLTFNEAESACKFQYQQGRLAPGMKNATYQATIDCVHRTQRLHAAIVNLAKTKHDAVAKGWKFGFPSNCDWNEPQTISQAQADILNLGRAGWFHDPLVFGDYQTDMIAAFQQDTNNLDVQGVSPPPFSAADKALLKGSVDFISMNYYSTNGIPASAQEVPSGAGCGAQGCWQTVWSRGIRNMANWYYQRYNMDIIITEVGYAGVDEATMTPQQALNDPNRLKFWQLHVQAVADAVEVDKVPVKGLLMWSLLDNFEWGYYDQKFGAVRVEGLGTPGASLTRTVKNSTYWVGDFYAQKKYNNPFVVGSVTNGTGTVTRTATHSAAISVFASLPLVLLSIFSFLLN